MNKVAEIIAKKSTPTKQKRLCSAKIELKEMKARIEDLSIL